MSFCGTVQTSGENENKENDGEDIPRRYNLRQRKPVDRYQAPLESRLNAQFLLKPYFLRINEIKFLNANTHIFAHTVLFQVCTFILHVNFTVFIRRTCPVHVLFLCSLAYLVLFFIWCMHWSVSTGCQCCITNAMLTAVV